MQFLKDLLQGKKGLAQTFWLWGALFGGILTLSIIFIGFTLDSITADNSDVDLGSNIFMIFYIIWSFFISFAIINAAKYNRDRGFWGWAATILSALSILMTVMYIPQTMNKFPLTWEDVDSIMGNGNESKFIELKNKFGNATPNNENKRYITAKERSPELLWLSFQETVAKQNENLPTQLGEGFEMTKMSASNYDKSLTYHFTVSSLPSIKSGNIDDSQIRKEMVGRCAEFGEVLGPVVKKIVYEYKARDNSVYQIEITTEDCGF